MTKVLWPALLVASAVDALLLALVDRAELRWMARMVGWSPAGIYTVVFLGLWAAACVLCMLVLLGGFVRHALAR